MKKVFFKHGEYPIIQGQRIESVYLQLTGLSVATVLDGENREVVYLIPPNGFMGVEVLLDGWARFTYEVVIESEMMELTVEEFQNVVSTKVPLFKNLMRFVKYSIIERSIRKVGELENTVKVVLKFLEKWNVKINLEELRIILGLKSLPGNFEEIVDLTPEGFVKLKEGE